MLDIIRVALSQYGIQEFSGKEINNPEVMKYYHETGRTWVSNDETPWCDAYFDWCTMKAGLKHSPGLNARGNLKLGVSVTKEEAQKLILEVPIIVIYWRVSIDSQYGHVGFPIRWHDNRIETLGGNQNNKVCIMPYQEDMVLDYRRLIK